MPVSNVVQFTGFATDACTVGALFEPSALSSTLALAL
jgi:hypothetical protein